MRLLLRGRADDPSLPLAGERAVGEHLDEYSSHHRSRLESCLRSVGRPVPIGERHARGRLVGEFHHGRDERLKISPRFRQRCSPDDPVEFRIVLPAVERQAVGVLLPQVVPDLPPRNLRGEEVEPQETVPGEVVLLTPAPRPAEREAVVVAVVRSRLPLPGVLFRERSGG